MTDFYIRADHDLTDYKCDQTIIGKKRYLKHVYRGNYEQEKPNFCKASEWHPFTNSYYAYTEDVDAMARVDQLLGSQLSIETFLDSDVPELESEQVGNAYSENAAQLQYLQSNPVSFLILGKPGIGEQELGKLLAEHWRCVYIDPEILIRDEIAFGSRAGLCIEFNLRCGRAISVDVIIHLLEKRLKSKSVQHRGFVLCGFPLISNDLYEADLISSESAVLGAQEIFEEIFKMTVDSCVQESSANLFEAAAHEEIPGEEQEQSPTEKILKPTQSNTDLDVGSAIQSNICIIGDLENKFSEQLNVIFNLLPPPLIIIYVVCANSDVISKHNEYYFDFTSKQVVDLQRERSDKAVYTFFSRVPGINEDIPDDFIDVVKNNTLALDGSIQRQLVKLPQDFPTNIASLLERYHYHALPIIEQHILTHDPQYIIKVDGRISPVRMFSALRTRLNVLPLQKVIIPQKLAVSSESGGEGGQTEDLDFEGLTFDECFGILRKKFIASPMFKWGLSDWGEKCPVAMHEGTYKNGDPKLAVQFMNKMFFLSNDDAYLKFYRNPRLYLLPPYPKHSCRIIIMGPPHAGKTAVAKCLGYYLPAEVLEVDKMEKNFISTKINELQQNIRSVALQEGVAILEEKRKAEWEHIEMQRLSMVDIWLKQQHEILVEGMKLKEFFQEESEDVAIVLEMSSFPVHLSYNKKSHSLLEKVVLDDDVTVRPDSETRVKKTVQDLQELFNFSGLPEATDIALCEKLLSNPEQLMKYLPPKLLPSDDVEPATIDDDFVRQYAEDVVTATSISDIQLTPAITVEMLRVEIERVEKLNSETGCNNGGWILDGLYPNTEIFEELCFYHMPHDVIVLTDTLEHEYLVKRFEVKDSNIYRTFRQFFVDLDKPDAAQRSPCLEPSESHHTRIVKDIMDEGDIFSEEKDINDAKNDDSKIDTYKVDLLKYDQEWEEFSSVLLDKDKIKVVEISVTDKSLEELLTTVIKTLDDRYRQLGSVFTDDDKLEELEDFGEHELPGEELGEGEEKDTSTEDVFFQNRRFGDTFNYCPVTFHDYSVLWSGKEEFTAKFENKLYLMSSEKALNSFVVDPRQYLLGSRPPVHFPPPRICVVGPIGSGKSTVTKALCQNFGLYHINYVKFITQSLTSKCTFSLNEILKLGLAGEKGEIIQNYLTTDEPLSEEFLSPIISKTWFEDPLKTFGFVFDDFPKRPSDVEYMKSHAAIPDIIVELSLAQEDISKRLVDNFVMDWQKSVDEKQEILELKHAEILNSWEERRTQRFKDLMEVRKEERYNATVQEKAQADNNKRKRPYLEDLAEAEEETDPSTARTKSLISYDSVVEEADIQAVNALLLAEMPEPIFEEEPEETLEEAVDRFSGELDESYNNDVNFLSLVREKCEEALIPWVTVDAGMTKEKVFAQAARAVDKYKFRNNSLFERVYFISVDLAEKLLSNGYYFLSKFGKTCPVQIYENINPVQMYLPLEQQFELFPVIHRQYIYYLALKQNRDKFKEDPLKYVNQYDHHFPLLPIRLAVIGPPKSGKTALSERFGREMGLKVISRGQAMRHVLRYLEASELAKNMDSILRLGWELTSDMAVKSAEVMAFDGKAITQGFVFDGFPESIDEVRHLAQMGLVPHLIIDLRADKALVFEFLSADPGKHGNPAFSKKFINHRYDEWLKTEAEFRDWVRLEYQNVVQIPVVPCKWGVWSAAYELSTVIFSEIKYYYKYCQRDVPLRLGNMLITPLEFIERQSCYLHYCLCCLHYDNALVSSGDPPNRIGVVQFRNFFYYVCPDHIDKFIMEPEQYISPFNNRQLPQDLPTYSRLSEFPDNVYEEGVCVICYWVNQPKMVLNTGELEYAVLYRDSIYLFDSLECMNTFMRFPHIYFSKTINFKGKSHTSLNYTDLPTLGMLEQFDSKQLIKAITNTGILRPILPGLSPSVSAALNMGLYLKVYNPRTPETFLPSYKETQVKFHETRTNLINYLDQMKSMINPYLYYDEPLPKFVDPLFIQSGDHRPKPPLKQKTFKKEDRASLAASSIGDLSNLHIRSQK